MRVFVVVVLFLFVFFLSVCVLRNVATDSSEVKSGKDL